MNSLTSPPLPYLICNFLSLSLAQRATDHILQRTHYLKKSIKLISVFVVFSFLKALLQRAVLPAPPPDGETFILKHRRLAVGPGSKYSQGLYCRAFILRKNQNETGLEWSDGSPWLYYILYIWASCLQRDSVSPTIWRWEVTSVREEAGERKWRHKDPRRAAGCSFCPQLQEDSPSIILRPQTLSQQNCPKSPFGSVQKKISLRNTLMWYS